MHGIVAWFVRNPIAANLVMLLIIIGGAFSIPALEKQFFPDFEMDVVVVTMPYLGAGPKEVEEQICVRIEEAVHDLNGIKEIRSIAREGSGTVMVEAELGYDMQRLTAEVKTRVDSITTFPAEAERPIITEMAHRHHMITVTIAGDVGEENLKLLGENLRDEVSALPYVAVVELDAPRAYEVSVEVSENTLRRYGLRFEDVVNAIRSSSLNLPAGAIKSESGDIRLQTRGQAYSLAEFETIVLVSKRDGTRVLLSDVAQIIDGFADEDIQTRFNGKPSHDLQIYVSSRPNVLLTSESVRAWAEEARTRLPEGVELAVWNDQADPFNARIETLVSNGIGGLILVYLVLVLFLRPLLAMWVCVGIAVAFLGTLFILPYLGVRLDMLSLFSFLLVLGIVVDDAIIVGESIHTRQTSGQIGDKGAILGTQNVIKPVMFAVISTMIFFVPMWMMPGEMAEVAFDIPTVVILALCFSLLECLLILPAHLAHMPPIKPSKRPLLAQLEILREACADSMLNFSANTYRPFLEKCLRSSFLTLSLFFVALLLTLAVFAGGWLRTGFIPDINIDTVQARIELAEGVAFSESLAVAEQVEQAALKIREDYNVVAADGRGLGHIKATARDNTVRVRMELLDSNIDSRQVVKIWREAIGDIGPVERFDMDFTIREGAKPIQLVLASSELSDLEAVSQELREALLSYPGVYNVNDTLQTPREEIELSLKPAAENLGITLSDLARQVRRAFYGAEAQRIPRPREDVKVMVRYPEAERVSVDNLNAMRIRTPDGREVPFETVAEVNYLPGYQTIRRLDRKRTLEMTAELVPGSSNPRAIVDEVLRDRFPRWKSYFPGLSIALDGDLEEEQEFTGAMLRYLLLSMLVVYGLMAIPFRSYWQPALILTAVPFGIMGAILGHLILGWKVSMFSMFGVLACAGVVVNDNLVLIDRINQLRAQGHPVLESILQGGQDRFRPIILTSITTFVGLLPIMSETSWQAQFLIPMAISLAFGVLFATGVTLVLVPSLYLVGEQFQDRFLRRRPQLAEPSA